MQGQHGNPGRFGNFRDCRGVDMGTIPTGTEFQGYRNRYCVDDGIEDLSDQRFILQQGGAAPVVAYFFGRASHVDVDDVRSLIDVVAGTVAMIAGTEPTI